MYNKLVFNIKPLGFMWETTDPFLFCVHHADAYPAGNEELGPAASLAGRHLGQDFTLKDGWRMYHGTKIPGFPAHPHRGFETITIVLNGIVDHSDSHGAAGRYGNGDVQWMTAGSGLQHAEMFPLLNRDRGNPLDLFQIWLNLPKSKKFVPPHFSMLWAKSIPIIEVKDKNEKTTRITLVAGHFGDTQAPAPAPDSWAANPENEVGIWLIDMPAEAEWAIPPASPGPRRLLYFYDGTKILVGGIEINSQYAIEMLPDQEIIVESGDKPARLLFLQGKPIGEPVSQYGPFVMNTQSEIQQAINDFRKTQFGGWPWPRFDNVHDRQKGRFARYANGKVETPE
ncbi:MAG: pirin family protein [Sphingobacteriia bacterium]|nr:pirin family protein [Sphingobacteriia bacterium]